jgi:hypothetical protein
MAYMTGQPVTLETLLEVVERAVRGDRRLLVQLFRRFQQLAHLPGAPAEERLLGEILSRVLMGDRSPDLSALPADMAEEIETMLARLNKKQEYNSNSGEANISN